MRYFVGLFLAAFAVHHFFLKEEPSYAGAAAGVEFPDWFKPDEWGPQVRAMNLESCRKAVADLEEFIANPPMVM